MNAADCSPIPHWARGSSSSINPSYDITLLKFQPRPNFWYFGSLLAANSKGNWEVHALVSSLLLPQETIGGGHCGGWRSYSQIAPWSSNIDESQLVELLGGCCGRKLRSSAVLRHIGVLVASWMAHHPRAHGFPGTQWRARRLLGAEGIEAGGWW